MAVEISGLASLRAKLRRIADAGAEGTDEGLGVGAKMLAERAAERAPRRTGELQDSITYERDKPGEWLAGTNLWRAHFTEFGTVRSAAHPFLFPSFEELRSRIAREIVVGRIKARFRAVVS